MYLGLRQASDLDNPAQLLTDLEHNWRLALPGFTEPARLSYFTTFGGLLTAYGIIAGLVATTAMCLMLMLSARVPFIDRIR